MRLSVVKSRSNEISRLMRARVFGVGREDPTDVLQHFFLQWTFRTQGWLTRIKEKGNNREAEADLTLKPKSDDESDTSID